MTSSSPRVIILEGPDGGGKSTLASDLAELGYSVRHTGPPLPGQLPYRTYLGSLAQAHVFQRSGIDERPFVFDRLHVGERVYGPVVRDHDQLGSVLHRQIDRVLLGIGGIVVYCATDYETMESTWKARVSKGEELITESSRYQALFNRYEEVIAGSPHTFRYDYKKHDVEFVNSIPLPHPNPGPGIGAWRPGISTLLVGERIAESSHGVDWPFTGISGSSAWLTEQLLKSGVPEDELYWVNAYKPDTEPLDLSFIEDLQPKNVIALGAVAKKSLQYFGIEHVEVPHPQYWKRFRSSEPYPLLEVLRANT